MRPNPKALSLALACIFTTVSVLGCDTDRKRVPPPAVDDTVGYSTNTPSTDDRGDIQAREKAQPQRSGMSSRTKKLVVLAGAAALYYLYKKHQNATAEGVDGQYYLSKNGRVYYRDEQHRAHWVTPPPQGIHVPEDEAAAYRDFQGYDNQPTGRDLRGLAEGAY